MDTQPEQPEQRPLGSFEFDSPIWWRKSGVWIVMIFSVAALFGYLTAPKTTSGRKNPDHTEAVNNARQIGIALYEFEGKYGKMPDASTIEAVKKDTATELNLGTKSSNDFFRQLFAAGITQSESMFYAKIEGIRKPDNIFAKLEALKKGECGFTYLLGATKGCNPLRPILVTPMIPGTNRFDPEPFHGKALILRADQSVSSVPIMTKTGRAYSGQMDLFDPANPIWDGHSPVIAWPE